MLPALLVVLVILIVGGLTVVGRSMRVVQQYERGLIFRFGKVLPETRGPGLTVIRPVGGAGAARADRGGAARECH